MENMSFQQRLMITLAVCAAILLVWPMIFPPPPVEDDAVGETEGETDGETDGATDGAVGDTDGAPAAEGPDGAEPPEPAQVAASEQAEIETHTITNGHIEVELSNAGRGLISKVLPLDEQYLEKDGEPLDYLSLGESRTLEIGFEADGTDFAYGQPRGLEIVEKDDDHFVLRYAEENKVEVLQRYDLLEGSESRVTVTVRNLSGAPQTHQLKIRGQIGEPDERSSYDPHRALCRVDDTVHDYGTNYWRKGPGHYEGDLSWIALDRRYFTQAIVPAFPVGRCDYGTTEDGAYLFATMVGPRTQLDANGVEEYELGLFTGAKLRDHLQEFSVVQGAALDETIDWGMFRRLSRFFGELMFRLLAFFHNLTGIWGLSIVLLTVVVKTILFPLTLRQMRSMRKMKEIQPEVQRLQAKYADDKEKLQQEMQALWQREGANPLAGCMPMLLQFPIWIALYAMLSAAVELYHEPFLWLPDLTGPDPYFIAPLGLGLLMYLNAKIQPSTGDNEQARMMQTMMPIMFTAMMLFLPSGLTVYIFANTALSLVQSYFLLRPSKTGDEAAAT